MPKLFFATAERAKEFFPGIKKRNRATHAKLEKKTAKAIPVFKARRLTTISSTKTRKKNKIYCGKY